MLSSFIASTYNNSEDFEKTRKSFSILSGDIVNNPAETLFEKENDLLVGIDCNK
jgi:hypothetical protein